jgi:hypothetical protein
MSGCEVANGELRCGRVQEQLMLRQLDVLLGGVDNALRTDFERRFELRWLATVLESVQYQHTRGMTSAGFWVRFCASSSLYTIRWAMSMSQ